MPVKIILFALIGAVLISCGKDKTSCYECDINMNGVYRDAGCMSKEDWNSLVITDANGNGSLDKDTYCRKK